MEKPFLSFIIPAYNESRTITKSISTAFDYLSKQKYTFEIIVVDDGSTDNTVELVKNFGNGLQVFRQIPNQGKGAAVRRGMTESTGKFRIFSDADLSTPIYEIEKAIEKLTEGHDIFIGSRAVDSSRIKEHQPFYREMMGKTFNKIVQFIVLKGIKDTQCGFKGFSEKAAKEIFSKAKINGFGFDVEILYLGRKLGLKMIEYPVDWFNDARSTVNPISDSFRMIIEILKIKKLHKVI